MKHKQILIFVGLLIFIGFQIYKLYVDTTPYIDCYRYRIISEINEKSFDSQYVTLDNTDCALDICDLNILDEYCGLNTINHRICEWGASDEVKIMHYGDSFENFNEFDEAGKLVKYTTPCFNYDGGSYLQIIVPDYSESDGGVVATVSIDNSRENDRILYYDKNGIMFKTKGFHIVFDDRGRMVKINEDYSYIEYVYLDDYQAEKFVYKDSTKTELSEYRHYDHFGFVDSYYYKYGGDKTQCFKVDAEYETYESGKIKSRTIMNNGKAIKMYSFNERGQILSFEDYVDSRYSCFWEYDDNGKILSRKTDTSIKKYSYRFNGRLEKIQEFRGKDKVFSLIKETLCDKYGNEEKFIKYDEDGKASENVTRKYVYF